MVYAKYGDIFRKFRKQKNVSLTFLANKSGISKATISQFENGKSLISLDRLERLLECLSITISDYFLLINNGIPEYFITKFQQIEAAFYNQDQDMLEDIHESFLLYYDEEMELVAISAKAVYQQLAPHELIKLEKLFYQKEMWDLFELYILIHTIERLDVNTVREIIESINKNFFLRDYLSVLHEYRALIINVLIKAIIVFIEDNDQISAKKTLERLNRLITEFDLTTKTITLTLKGCIIYWFSNEKLGEEFINDSFDIMRKVGAEKLEIAARMRVSELMKKYNNQRR